jgi:hypothetical protein
LDTGVGAGKAPETALPAAGRESILGIEASAMSDVFEHIEPARIAVGELKGLTVIEFGAWGIRSKAITILGRSRSGFRREADHLFQSEADQW